MIPSFELLYSRCIWFKSIFQTHSALAFYCCGQQNTIPDRNNLKEETFILSHGLAPCAWSEHHGLGECVKSIVAPLRTGSKEKPERCQEQDNTTGTPLVIYFVQPGSPY